jgi:hypothetical protein
VVASELGGGWHEPIRGKERGTGLAGGHAARKGVRAADSDAATASAVTVERRASREGGGFGRVGHI